MHNLNNRIFGVFFIILSLQSVSCGNKLPEEITGDTPSKEIVNLGDTAFSKGYYTRAGEYYLELNRFHPYSSLDGKALYKAVDAFYRAGKYEKTRFAANKFLLDYSNTPEAEQVIYTIAWSYCREILNVDRDQGAAKNCIASLKRFLSLYPSSKNKKNANNQIKYAQEFLVGQELTIGKYYLEKKNPSAAIRRLKGIQKSVKSSKFFPETGYRLTEAYLMMGLIDDALAEEKKMKKMFPDSSWTSEGSKLMAKFGPTKIAD